MTRPENIKGISRPQLSDTIIKKNGNTQDIINAVLKADKQSQNDTKEFSKQFTPDREGLYNLWKYVKYNYRYKEDPKGEQWIKTPARLHHDKIGDCKSYTIFINSVLKNLGLDYIIRFISQDSDKDATHVYSVAILPDGEKIVIDAVYHQFNKEPKRTYKYDYYNNTKSNKMTKISYLNGIETDFNKELDKVKKFDFANATEAERQEVLMKEFFLIDALNKENENEAAAAAANFVNFQIEEEEKKIINKAASEQIKAVKEAAAVEGIGFILLIPSVRKKVINTLSRVLLPKTGLLFLYTQVSDKYLSEKAKAKKRRQDKFKGILTKAAEMTPATFDMLITNAIKSKTGKTPLQIVKSFYPQAPAAPAPAPTRNAAKLQYLNKPQKAAAVGFAGAGVLITQAAGFLTGLVQKIAQLVKGFKAEDALKKGDLPSGDDFAGFADPDQADKTPIQRAAAAAMQILPAARQAATAAPEMQKPPAMQTPPAMGDKDFILQSEGNDTQNSGGSDNKKMYLIGAGLALAAYLYYTSTQKK